MSDIKIKRIQPKPLRSYLLSFTVVMGQSWDTSSNKFTRSKSIIFTTNLVGEEFALEARKYIIEHAKEHFVFTTLKGMIKVLSLVFDFKELPT